MRVLIESEVYDTLSWLYDSPFSVDPASCANSMRILPAENGRFPLREHRRRDQVLAATMLDDEQFDGVPHAVV
jgi:hypothetical protein